MDGEIHNIALKPEQTIQARKYDRTIKPDIYVRSNRKLCMETLILAIKPWPQSSVQPRTEAVGLVIGYYPFGQRTHDGRGYWLSVKHEDGTIAVYCDCDLMPI